MNEHETIASALVAALTDLTNVVKANKADTGRYGYTYASISDLIADTRPTLAEHGLVALTPVHEHPEGLACTVTILHSSGERLDFGPTPFPSGKDAQSTGSWITYMRRYCLLAALGMGAEDDDGKAAQAPPRQQQRAQEPPPQGITSKEAGERVRAKLEADGVPDAVEHAKQVWRDVQPKAVDGRVPDAEVERLLSAAEAHADDIRALA